MKDSITAKRNKQIVGHNSKSYNDKHPENPVSLRPIHDAIKNTPYILDEKRRAVPNRKEIARLRALSNLPRMEIEYCI